MSNWAQILAILSFCLALVGPLGVVLALRGSKLQEEQKIAERVRGMYQAENTLLLARVTRLEADSKQCNKMQEFIIDILKKVKGIELEIDDSMITLRDSTGTRKIQRMSDTGPLPAV